MLHRQNSYISVFLLGLCAFIWYNLRELPYNVAYYPRFLVICFALLSLMLLLRAVYHLTRSKGSGQIGSPVTWHARSIALVILTAVYIVSLPHIGYVVTTISFIPLLMWLLGVRNWLVLVLAPLVTTGVLYFSFTKGLMVPLPAGLLF